MTDKVELATYNDFLSHFKNLSKHHLAELRALYIDGGIEHEDVDEILETESKLDGKRVLIVDEVSRTGSTLSIAVRIFQAAFPKAAEIQGNYFWHPSEAPLMMGAKIFLQASLYGMIQIRLPGEGSVGST